MIQIGTMGVLNSPKTMEMNGQFYSIAKPGDVVHVVRLLDENQVQVVKENNDDLNTSFYVFLNEVDWID